MSAHDQSRRPDDEMSAEFQIDRQSLRDLFAANASTTRPLGDDFARRVVRAAAQAGVRERLPNSHPLRRLSESIQPIESPEPAFPASTVPPTRTWMNRRLVWGIAAAASLALVASIAVRNSGSGGNDDPSPTFGVIAQTDPVPVDEPTNVPLDAAPTAPEMDLMAARTTDAAPENASIPNSIKPDETVAAAMSDSRASSVPGGSSPALVPAGMSVDAMVATPPPPPRITGAVLVYNVRLTSNGRASDAVRTAMRVAGLDRLSEKAIDESVLATARQAGEAWGEESFQVLYLRASAKKLDRLLKHLASDVDGVQSVGMTLATDAPLLQIVANLDQVDPTKIRNVPVSYELDARDRKWMSSLAGALNDRSFMPIQGRQPGSDPSDQDSPGEDILSDVLVLIR